MMSSVTEIHSKPQHYRVTLTDAIAHYKNGDLTAKGLLHFYARIHLRFGWERGKTQKEICEELGLSRATFYSAKAKLEAEGVCFFRVEDSTKFFISLGQFSQSTTPDTQSRIVDCQSTTPDTQSRIVDCQSRIVENERPKPAPVKESKESPYSSSDSYQIFLKSLSEEERERFLNFQKRKAKKLPEYPSSDGWFRKNFEHHAEEWRESEGKTAPAASQDAKWENHPRREEWLAEIANLTDWHKFTNLAGSNHAELVQRGDFYDWVEANDVVPGIKKQPKKVFDIAS